jgi:prepilin-type N-terminal cleavage/methylation domain-containing protein
MMSVDKTNHLSRNRCGNQGFTLIEIMVAMAILAILTVLTAQAIQTAIANRSKAKAIVSRESSVRDALSVIQNDLAAAFHHRDFEIKMYNEIVAANNAPKTNPGAPPADSDGLTPPPTPTPAPAPTQETPPAPKLEPRPTPQELTGFSGDAESVYFTVLNHTRTTRDAPESDQAKVGYFVKDCKSRQHPDKMTKCLYRSLATELDDDVKKPGPASLLLENIEMFQLRYLGPGSDDLVDHWQTGTNSRDKNMADNFPYAVEVTLSVHDKNDANEKLFSAQVLAPLHFPNNLPKKSESGKGGAPGA